MLINTVYCEDNRATMLRMPENSIDLIATDPPYGMKFMGTDWDKALPAQNIFNAMFHVLKPGAFCFVFSHARQDLLYRMTQRLENAGFMIDFPSLYWTYATGIGLGANCGKLIDKRLGLDREVVGERNPHLDGGKRKKHTAATGKNYGDFKELITENGKIPITAPASDLAKEFNEAYIRYRPKNCLEVILVAMKLIEKYRRSDIWEKLKVDYFWSKSEKKGVVTVRKKAINPALKDETWIDGKLTESKPYRDTIFEDYTTQAMMNGKACTWLDRVRIPVNNGDGNVRINDSLNNPNEEKKILLDFNKSKYIKHHGPESKQGRYPANLIAQGDALDTGVDCHKAGNKNPIKRKSTGKEDRFSGLGAHEYNSEIFQDSGSFSRYFDFDAWASKHLPRTYPFLPVAKPSRGHKAGRESHLTEKPPQIFAYLITLASRPGDLIFDPFTGSGSSLLAAAALNRDYIGSELEEKHVKIARGRLSRLSVQREEREL